MTLHFDETGGYYFLSPDQIREGGLELFSTARLSARVIGPVLTAAGGAIVRAFYSKHMLEQPHNWAEMNFVFGWYEREAVLKARGLSDYSMWVHPVLVDAAQQGETPLEGFRHMQRARKTFRGIWLVETGLAHEDVNGQTSWISFLPNWERLWFHISPLAHPEDTIFYTEYGSSDGMSGETAWPEPIFWEVNLRKGPVVGPHFKDAPSRDFPGEYLVLCGDSEDSVFQVIVLRVGWESIQVREIFRYEGEEATGY